MQLWFYLSTALLAALLYLPTQRLIWTLSVRRLARKLQRELKQEEVAGQARRAYIVAAIIVLPFSLLFNISLMG